MSRRWDSNRDRPYPPYQGRGGYGGSNNRYQHGGRGRGGRGTGWRNDYYGRYNQNGASRGHTTAHYRSVAQNGNVGPPPPPAVSIPPRSGNAAQPRQQDAILTAMNVDATNRQKSDDNASEPKKAFADMEYKEQLEAQIPHTEKDKAAFMRKLPAESLSPKTPSGKKAHTFQWKDHKEKVAAKLVEQMKASWPKHNSANLSGYDSEEIEEFMLSDDPPTMQSSTEEDVLYPVLYRKLEQYILALPTCHLMSIGFDFSGTVNEEMCFCPCHHQQTKQWRTLAGIDVQGGGREEGGGCEEGGECKAKSRFDTPNALVAHLRTMHESCTFHKYTLLYLEELYADWHKKGLKHKGMYCVGTTEYLDAVAQEQKQRDRILLDEMSKWDEQQKKIDEEMEALKKTNASLVATTREKQGGREEILKRLGVDLYNPRNWAPPSAEDMLPKDKRMYTRFLKRIQDRFRTQGKKSKRRTVRVKQGFSLSEMFETWSSQDYEGFESILFKDLQGASDVSHLLSRWRINYDVHEAFEDSSKEDRESFTAVDEGGPEKQFFSEVWQMLPSLEVTLPGSAKKLALFEAATNGYPTYFPKSDDQFEAMFKDDESKEAKSKAQLFYRAIGRIFVHCLFQKHAVPKQVLPKLLCNAFLRDCKPTDPDYSSLDLALHLEDFGWNAKTIKQFMEEHAETPKAFREEVEEYCISAKSLWADSFMEGVTVTINSTSSPDVCVPLSECLSSISLENVEHLAFATHKFSAEDLFKMLHPTYSKDDTLKEIQKHFFNESLKQVLESWDEENRGRLHGFVEYCTGQTYLNTDPHSDFKIEIVFEQKAAPGNSGSDERLPEVHTCEMTLSFPPTAYNGNPEKLDEKLGKAIDICRNQYTMN